MLFFLFTFGIIFGSFANVVILRLYSGKHGIIAGRSECPTCGHALGFLDLIPVISWIWLRGKCRYCQSAISPQYPIVEFTMGVLWLLAGYLVPVSTLSPWIHWAELLLLLLLIWSLVVITVYDLKYLEIPDAVSLPTIAVLLVTLPLSFTPVWHDALIAMGMVVGFFLLQILVSRGKWIGGGDLRMGAIMGLSLGVPRMLLSLFLAYFLGSIISLTLMAIGKKTLTSHIAFGPFLALGTLIGLLRGEELAEFFRTIMGL